MRLARASLLVMLLILQQAYTLTSNGLAFAAGREINVPDLQFQPIRPTEAITLKEAVETALRNYPSIAQKHFKLRASIANVALAKTQYLPNLNVDIQ